MSNQINSYKTTVLSSDKKGELLNAYSPLLNLVNSKLQLGDFTSKKLNFDRYTPVDMLITDEYDGSENIIINDDKNNPKLINSRFSVQENKTFNIPIHSGNAVTNVYEERTFDKDTQLLKLYDKIPTLVFKGIFLGGSFKIGKYIFYFKLSDSDGNQTNIVLESGIIQMHIGDPDLIKIRMGMQDENSEKCIKFELKDIDRGFDYVKIFYERSSTDESQALVNQYYMIQLNFPIRNGKCDILLTGAEDILEIAKSDLLNEFADISSVKTLEIVDNTLFLGNISAFEQDYQELLRMSWKIIPRMVYESNIGQIQTQNYSLAKGKLYYSAENIYNNVGYWDDEFYRFGIVYIYNNNLLSPVFNIQGCDMNTLIDGSGNELYENDLYKIFFKSDDEEWDLESEDFFFNKTYRTNSKGVIRLPLNNKDSLSKGVFIPNVTKILFDLSQIHKKAPDSRGVHYKVSEITTPEEYLKYLGIKGFFFVRQKRIPTIIAQGMVVGLTKKDFGSIPVLKNVDGKYTTKSFLGQDRLLHSTGSDIEINSSNVSNQALLVPNYEIDEATLNLIFTGLEFCLKVESNISTEHYINKQNFIFSSNKREKSGTYSGIKLTAVPKETKLLTDGNNYFSTIAGTPDEPYKTSDVNKQWDKTLPQDLTVSTSLIRGNWGSFIGMSKAFDYGDIISIRSNDFYDLNHDILEYEKRFKDYSFYSSISTRYNVSDLSKIEYKITCARGDCFKGLFTHRMMSNFIDPELPTNTKIVDPACWAKNYAVRCTAEIITKAHSNLTSDSGGWYIPSPVTKKSAIVSLIFGILTGNIGIAINAINELNEEPDNRPKQDTFANEIVLAFEIYVGGGEGENASPNPLDENNSPYSQDDPDADKGSLYIASRENHIKKVNPKEQESNSSGLNLKAIFKSDDKWELHGLASINRSDVNAVSFGQWITFPFCSSYNLSMRDIDFSHATEEASFNRKRAFYPWEEMDPKNHLLESGTINGAAKVSLASNNYPAYTTVPYIKQEFFNRIYWSKPNVAETFINSYRIIFKDQYREYNKEFGAITKLVELGNSLLVVFQHGLGLLPVNRTPQNERESSPYLSSKSVLPNQVQTLTSDYGSMWKDSVIKSPYTQCVYGVDTVAKKIWKIGPQGNGLEFISDFKVQKFLNDWIDLSEYDFNEYQGHINVKTHYNEFKHDVIFTYYRDIPLDSEGNVVDLSGNLVLEDTEDPKSKIASWRTGITWSLCYNEITKQFITFYDWYPVESCNVDNIFFSFDKDAIDEIYTDDYTRPNLLANSEKKYYTMNKVFADKMCTENTKVYILPNIVNNDNNLAQDPDPGNGPDPFDPSIILPKKSPAISNISQSTIILSVPNWAKYISLYYKGDACPLLFNESESLTENTFTFGKDKDWKFVFRTVNPEDENTITLLNSSLSPIYILDCHFTNCESKDLNPNDPVLKYEILRNIEGPQMYLWKHGQSGLYDNQGKIKPTFWYGKQHEFNFEFVVNQDALILKIFNNLKIISNKTEPNKFEYEVVGEGYDWFDLKPVVLWINKKAASNYEQKIETDSRTEKDFFKYWYYYVLATEYGTLKNLSGFPELFGYKDNQKIKKLPFLHLETCDRKGRKDKSYYQNTDFWDQARLDEKDSTNNKDVDYKFNTSEVILVEDDQLNEQRVHTESLGNDVRKYGRLRGNMQYLEDLWDVEIRPIKFQWAYVDNNELKLAPSKEARHRDKYIKIKVRYTGKDLAVIQGIITMFDYSMA